MVQKLGVWERHIESESRNKKLHIKADFIIYKISFQISLWHILHYIWKNKKETDTVQYKDCGPSVV